VGANDIRFHGVTPQFTVADLVKTAEYYRDVLSFQISSFRDCNGLVLAFAENH